MSLTLIPVVIKAREVHTLVHTISKYSMRNRIFVRYTAVIVYESDYVINIENEILLNTHIMCVSVRVAYIHVYY